MALVDTAPPSERSPERSRRRWRRTIVVVAVALLAAAVVGVLALFQPWKLWVDDTVDQAAPAGAVPLTTDSPAPVSPPPESPAPDAGPATTVVPAPTTVPAPGAAPTQFVSRGHGTTGSLVFLADGQGRRYARFEGLDTSNGPDLKVYLSTNPVDGPEQAFDDDFVDLGRLQGNIGDQNYEIAAGVDLSRYRSVVIWCDRFNSAFGAAPVG